MIKKLRGSGHAGMSIIILRNPPADYVPQEGLGKLFYKGKALTKGSSASLRCLEVAVSVGGG